MKMHLYAELNNYICPKSRYDQAAMLDLLRPIIDRIPKLPEFPRTHKI